MRGELIKHELSDEVIHYDDYIAGLAKGLQVLEAFGVNKQKLNVAQVADKTGISITATRRYLKTLKFLGYLDTDNYYYWLSHKVLKFSGAFLNTAHLPRVSQSILNFLATNTSFVYSVSLLDNYESVAIARSSQNEDGFRVRPFGIHLGSRVPAHTSSSGKVLLANRSHAEQMNWLRQYELTRFTAFTCTNEDQFLAKLQQVREDGYCISSEEYEMGVTALSVPIVNYAGETIAGLSAVVPVNKVSDQYLIDHILPLLRDAAKEIKAMI